ncbi:AsmA family protein [methanotrophic bacterial endosymbiont of Bathymodiolus sp.]|nr:AsmA family protein [methanotrophic bacterial endosymbiont of Bathymodiolus sp.]
MGKLIKVILVFFSSVALLIIAAAIIIPLAVDLNDYKTEMEVAVEEQTGRTLKIEGDLHVSVFPWLGFSTGKLILSNAAGFAEHPFAAIDEADIKVKLIPLFSKKVEISTIVLKGLALNLEKNKQGVSNWSDLTAEKEAADLPSEKELEQLKNSDKKNLLEMPTEKTADAEPVIELAAIKIGGLAIENSQVTWDDQQADQQIVVKDFNLSTSAVVFNKPIAINLSMLLENSEPAVTEQLGLSMNLVIDETLQKVQLHNFKLDSVTKGETVPGGILEAQLLSEIDLDLQAQTLALKGLQLKTDNLQLAGDINTTQLILDPHYSGKLQIAPFSPKALMQQLAMNVPVTADKQVLQKLALSLDLQGTKDSVALENLKITLDDTNINGYARVKQFDQPAITFQLTIDAIDVDRYSAPKQQASPAKPATNTVAKATVAEATLMPMDTLRQLNLDGDLKIAKLKVAQLTMAGVNLNIQAQQGIVKTKQSIAQLYQGSYQGQITINAKDKTPRISLNEKISNVQLEPLVNDLQPDGKVKLKGQANITANLSGKGNTVTAIKSGLGGRLNFSINKGAIPGFNVQQLIDIGKLATKGKKMQQSYASEQTLFSTIKGSAKVKKGIINNPDFLAESSTVEVKGGGTANLNNDALDYKVIAKIKKGGKNVTNRPVAVNVKGTFSKPVYTVDLTSIESMMTEEEKQKVNKFIGKQEKEIDKALGEGSGKAVNKLLKGFFN